jgi:hypothetical protein
MAARMIEAATVMVAIKRSGRPDEPPCGLGRKHGG